MKIINISNCNKCPYYRIGGMSHRAWCVKGRENFEWEHHGDIPKWCPLEDVHTSTFIEATIKNQQNMPPEFTEVADKMLDEMIAK